MSIDSEMQPHPAAEIFPVMSALDFDTLVADIKQNGQLEPIVVYSDTILDGRHRYRACQQLSIEPITTEWKGKGSPEDFVISKNLHRRHLNGGQRAMIAALLATLKQGQKKANTQVCVSSQHEAAKLLNVSHRAVQYATVVRDKAAPEMVQAVKRGEIPPSTAAELAHLSHARQSEIAAKGRKTAAKVAKRVRMRQQARSASVRRKSLRLEMDPEFELEANAAARDLEIERDERIAMSGADQLADENAALRKQIALLDRRIAAMLREKESLKYRAKMWEERAKSAGWKGRADA